MLEGRALKEHTLNRLGYGMSEWHATRYDQLGFDRYVAQQLDGSLAAISRQGTTVGSKLDRAVLERRQLETVLLDFWFNHFNVDATGGMVKRTVGVHQAAISSRLLGKFGDLLLATAQSPAMLDYLDNRINFKEEVRNGIQLGLNENYARELMELHTLGVDGGYVEADVVEVAKVLTGWSTRDDVYLFKASRHDRTQKTVMGATFPAGRNEEEGRELLAMLAANPSTASFLSGKLCRRLVSENPPSSVVNASASAYESSDGDLAETVRTILTADGFKADAAFRSKVKPPHRYVASALLAMGANGAGQYAGIRDELLEGVGLLGETPYEVAPPTGYPESSGFWVSGASMLGRFGLANIIVRHGSLRNRLKTVSGANGAAAGATVDAVASYMLPGGISGETRDAAVRLTTDRASNNDERVSMAALAVLSSPEFVRF
ncbi:MAG: DUF1800 domain-containing protein [Acidimicrobiales bacterium]